LILFCLRHPPLPQIWSGRFLGQMDPRSIPTKLPISFINNLKQLDITRIISSDLVRCLELASSIQLEHFPDLSIQEDKRIREIFFGDWEGKTYQEISESSRWRNDYNQFIQKFPKFPAPNGETNEEFEKRIQNFLSSLKEYPNSNILIVSHSGVIRQIAALSLGIPLEITFKMQLDYTSISRFQIEKDFTSMVSWNEDWLSGEKL
jgi:alpha-ribazole phosphatase